MTVNEIGDENLKYRIVGAATVSTSPQLAEGLRLPDGARSKLTQPRQNPEHARNGDPLRGGHQPASILEGTPDDGSKTLAAVSDLKGGCTRLVQLPVTQPETHCGAASPSPGGCARRVFQRLHP